MDIFYVAVIPVFAVMLCMILHLHHVRKHDLVLYRFCQIRRDLMRYLRQNGYEMNGGDYAAARQLLVALNHIIHDYNLHKSALFNGRQFFRFLHEYDNSSQKVEVVKTDNVKIASLRSEASAALTKAFFVYTPLFKHEIFLKLSIFSLSIVALLGIRKVNYMCGQLKRTEARLKSSHSKNSSHVGCPT